MIYNDGPFCRLVFNITVWMVTEKTKSVSLKTSQCYSHFLNDFRIINCFRSPRSYFKHWLAVVNHVILTIALKNLMAVLLPLWKQQAAGHQLLWFFTEPASKTNAYYTCYSILMLTVNTRFSGMNPCADTKKHVCFTFYVPMKKWFFVYIFIISMSDIAHHELWNKQFSRGEIASLCMFCHDSVLYKPIRFFWCHQHENFHCLKWIANLW